MDIRLYLLQRASATVLALCVALHLGLIVFAVRGGLSGEEILLRTRGSPGWAAFYGLFVLAAAAHGSIGLRDILMEWARLGRGAANGAAWAAAAVLLVLGLRAVWAVVS